MLKNVDIPHDFMNAYMSSTLIILTVIENFNSTLITYKSIGIRKICCHEQSTLSFAFNL